MSENLNERGKPAWLRIAGDQAFNVYALILVSSIATIGTLSIYVGYNPSKFLTILAILAISQLVALSPIFVIAPISKRIRSDGNRLGVIIATYILVNVLRSALLDALLVKWGLESESHLAFRLYSNVVFLTLLYTILAWISDFITENFSALTQQESAVDGLNQKFYETAQEISQARNYASRELIIEIGAMNSALESLSERRDSEFQFQKFIAEIQDVTKTVRMKLQKLVDSYPNRGLTPLVDETPKLSVSKVFNVGTYFTPYSPILMGGLSFIALAGWLGYFIDRETALKWAAYLAIYSFVVYWLYARFLVPIMRNRKTITRFVIYELSLVPFTFFWIALLGYYAGDNSTTYVIAATNSISVFVFANLATFTTGLLGAVRENRNEIEITFSKLEVDLNAMLLIKQREELIWQELFASDISNSPTTATVQLRDAISDFDEVSLEKVQPSVLTIWRNVDKLLEL